MRVTISRADKYIAIDGVARPVDCSDALPAYVSVIQWSDETLSGWIEFVNDPFGAHLPNTTIVDLSPYVVLLDRWAEAFAAAEEAAAGKASESSAAENALVGAVETLVRSDDGDPKAKAELEKAKRAANAKLDQGRKVNAAAAAVLLNAKNARTSATEKRAALKLKS